MVKITMLSKFKITECRYSRMGLIAIGPFIT
jgi:hypothetical protein